MPDPQKTIRLTICMGSSCFSRGNGRNIEVIQDYLAQKDLPAAIELEGHLCEGACKNGPNLIIDGRLYQEVDPVAVIGLLNHHVAQKAKDGA